MIFNHHWMLWGLFALAVPILIHLLNRSRAKVLDWGAMRFLLASLTSQTWLRSQPGRSGSSGVEHLVRLTGPSTASIRSASVISFASFASL